MGGNALALAVVNGNPEPVGVKSKRLHKKTPVVTIDLRGHQNHIFNTKRCIFHFFPTSTGPTDIDRIHSFLTAWPALQVYPMKSNPSDRQFLQDRLF